ncbi:MAG: hypothetical protein QOG57_4423, partial [Pseudonocardiales bacterium]|nr:hypothetical protein [Pseudonocardiales bacterium]
MTAVDIRPPVTVTADTKADRTADSAADNKA